MEEQQERLSVVCKMSEKVNPSRFSKLEIEENFDEVPHTVPAWAMLCKPSRIGRYQETSNLKESNRIAGPGPRAGIGLSRHEPARRNPFR
jgi:hypothetical protein